MLEHPYIDFDGDGHGDDYDSASDNHGHYVFLHHDAYGRVDALAYDNDHDGLIESMVVDANHDGTMDHVLDDTNGDGIMDTANPVGGGYVPLEHPYIDFDGDGHGDPYRTFVDASGTQNFVHTDGYGHVDAVAMDADHDGLIDKMYIDGDHDGHIDHLLYDTNHDGIMDLAVAV
jgi:hypothetical protein